MPQTLTSDQNFDRMVWCDDHNLPGPSRDGSELHLEKKIKVVAPLAASMIPCFAKFHANIAILRTQTVHFQTYYLMSNHCFKIVLSNYFNINSTSTINIFFPISKGIDETITQFSGLFSNDNISSISLSFVFLRILIS